MDWSLIGYGAAAIFFSGLGAFILAGWKTENEEARQETWKWTPTTPSDILAGLVITQIKTNPTSVEIKLDGPLIATWVDKEKGITLIAYTTPGNPFDSIHGGWIVSFSSGGQDLIITDKARRELLSAIKYAQTWQMEVHFTKMRYDSDMAACDAIQKFV